MGGFSLWHILIFALILLLVFGGNRFSSMMSDVAKGLKNFKQGLSEDDAKDQRPPQQPGQIRNDRPIDVTPEPRPAETSVPRSDDQAGR
jgi:sec-independent protein translocase protein TatA